MTSPAAPDSDTMLLPIQQLLDPAAYPHPTTQLQLVETHISWVVLTGQFAYKIKKPVHYEFIDASTLSLRRHYCDEELRLNRRLAADLYLDVVPIFRANGQLRVGDTATTSAESAIEYAVRMKQFAPEAALTNLLKRNDVCVGEIADLARLLAQFHASAPRASWDGTARGTAQLYNAVLGTSVDLMTHALRLDASHSLRDLLDWLRDRAIALESAIELRERQGWIRECHGDLHAGNVVRWHDALTPFDCIEFDPGLRWIDTMSDLAFLVMDLVSHERLDLAVTLLNTYLEIVGDYAAARLLPFYAAYRALVRAKVDALAIAQRPGEPEKLQERLQRRIHTAQQWTNRQQPTLVLMHGLSGSGKSWLSERLVSTLPAIRVRSDVERKRMQEPNAIVADPALYTAEMNHRTYARLADCAESCLQAGFNVVVDATFLERTDRDLFRGLARGLRTRFIIVSCSADEDTLRARVQARSFTGKDPSDADSEVLTEQLRHWTPLTIAEREETVVAKTFDPAAVEHVITAIRNCA